MSQGMDMFGGIMKQGQDMMKQAQDAMTQTMGMGMQVFQQAMSNGPFQDAVKMMQEAMESATDYPQQMMEIMKKGAEEASKMAEGAAGQSMQMFQEGMKQVQSLQDAGAPKSDYMALMKKMQGNIPSMR